ncbi:MAG: hypothetical protein JXB32_16055, partial [Deltaproteobacteria bacterium]|nr:hypothetical protein [Deltaproteobacteria bacterium]
MKRHRRIGLLATAALLATGLACGSGNDNDDDTDVPGDVPLDGPDDAEVGPEVREDVGPTDDAFVPPDVPVDDALAILELHALDLWARPLAADATLAVAFDGTPVAPAGFPVAWLPLTDYGSLDIRLVAPDFEPLHVTADFSFFDGLFAFTARLAAENPDSGLVVAQGTREIEGRTLTVYSAFLGLRHRWFSAQARPMRRGNEVALLMDGEEAWQDVHGALRAAARTVHISTWWWESDAELLRDAATHPYLTEAERWGNTIFGTLGSLSSGVTRRVLVGQFWGQDSILTWMNTDPELRAAAERPGDGFEFMGQANETSGVFWFAPTPFRFGDRVRATHPELAGLSFAAEEEIESRVPPREVDLTDWPVTLDVQHASYHQKFLVLDGGLAYVGGMNLRNNDWDTNRHEVFEARRMPFDATTAERQAVLDREALPEQSPRKDYQLRIRGPAAMDAEHVFRARWNWAIASNVEFSEYSSNYTPRDDVPEVPGGVPVQITTTLPDPFWEHGIAETWFNAVANAERYILIEDQYWRMPMMLDALVARMTAVPSLRLAVITKPIAEWTDPGCYWTYRFDQELRTRFPDRYRTYQLRSFDTQVTWGIDETECRFLDIDVHSKLLLVDDRFLSVGSCNKNNRGLVYEGEMNAAVLDDATAREARRRVLANLMPGTTPTDDVPTWWAQLENAAAWNDQVRENWADEGDDLS